MFMTSPSNRGSVARSQGVVRKGSPLEWLFGGPSLLGLASAGDGQLEALLRRGLVSGKNFSLRVSNRQGSPLHGS